MFLRFMAVAAAVLWSTGVFAAAERASMNEAKAMVLAAERHFDSYGYDSLVAAVHGDAFRDRDLYVFVLDLEGVVHAHGTRPDLVGANRMHRTDARGQPFVKHLVITGEAGGGWVYYVYRDPVTGREIDKASYVRPLNEALVLGVGVYAE